MSIITHHGYLMNGSKFGQRKNTGYPVFLWLILPPADTSEIEKINVLLHEKHHLINDDCNNSLSQIDTFKNHIENDSEKGLILDFMSLVNSEYPIDDSFNYQDYLKNADIPLKYENYVKEIETQFYNRKQKNNTI